MHAADAVLPVGVHVGDDLADRGDAVHLHGHLGDHAETALAAQDHLVHAGPGVAARDRLGDGDAGGMDHPQAADDVLDVAVLVRLHAGGAGRGPAAEGRVGEGVGEVADGPAQGVQLLLEVGAVDARLDAGEARGVVDLEHLAHAAEVHGEDRALLVDVGGDGAGDGGAAAVGDQHHVVLEHEAQHARDLVLARRVDDRVDQALEVSVAGAEQVRQGAAEGVDDAVLVVVEQVVLADDLDERGAARRAEARGGHVVVGEHRLDRLLRVEVDADLVLRERGEGGLVVVAEGDVVQAPPPPLVPPDLACAQPIAHASSSSPRTAPPRTSS